MMDLESFRMRQGLIAVMGFLSAACVPNVATGQDVGVHKAAAKDTRSGPDQTDWYGAYLGGTKVGYARTVSRTARVDERADGIGYVVELQMTLQVQGHGSSDTLRIADVRSYAYKPPHRLMAGQYEQKASNSLDRRTYHAKGAWAEVTRRLNKQPSTTSKVRSSKESYGDQIGSWKRWVRSARSGQRMKGVNFAWDRLEDVAYEAVFKGAGPVMLSGLKVRVGTFEIQHENIGLKGRARVLEDGTMLEMTLGPQLNLRLQESTAAQSNVGGLDVGTAGIVPDRRIEDAHLLKEITLEVKTPPGLELPVRGQRLESQCKGGACRVIIRARPGGIVSEAGRKAALVSSHAIDSGHISIKQKANTVVAGTDGAVRIQRLVEYVYTSLKKRLATNLPSASMVLKQGFGDCTEHTWLFVALSRALGVPARPVYGLAYVAEGPKGRFAYHAWAEVELDGRWVEVDPTWGQIQADVTHLRLGEDAGAIAASYGGLEIVVIESVKK